MDELDPTGGRVSPIGEPNASRSSGIGPLTLQFHMLEVPPMTLHRWDFPHLRYEQSVIAFPDTPVLSDVLLSAQ